MTLNRSTFWAECMKTRRLFIFSEFICINICIFILSRSLWHAACWAFAESGARGFCKKKKKLVGSCVYCTIQLSFVYILSSARLNYERSWSVFVKNFYLFSLFQVSAFLESLQRISASLTWFELGVEKSISSSRIHTLDTKTFHKGKRVASVSGLRLTQKVSSDCDITLTLTV